MYAVFHQKHDDLEHRLAHLYKLFPSKAYIEKKEEQHKSPNSLEKDLYKVEYLVLSY